MSDFFAPQRDLKFAIEALVGLDDLATLPGFEDVNGDLVDAILEEAGRFASEALAPLNVPGDRQGSVLNDGKVTTPDGFKEAYQQFIEAGWNGLTSDPEYDGQGLPIVLGSATSEIWQAANMSFALGPMLTASAAKAINNHGTDEQRETFLRKLISGEWTGTMNLTEPQAGSDLSAVATKAEPQGDGSYKLFGQKIFITWGDHDCTENVVHTVLARLPDAPEGVKGISLFIVPKFLVNKDGSLGDRNDVECVSLEHKLGIHASPTAVMGYGNNGGATGYLVGEANRGLVYMFTMMNDARLAVGVQGCAIAERAYQHALTYAKDRVQGRPVGQKSGERVAILHHPDVRRMLLTMKSQIEAMRALHLVASMHLDFAKRAVDDELRRHHQSRSDLLIPVVKGWCTEVGFDLAALGVQVHGGMGFIEETGAAQYLRDARIATIYEGTTGIQANDLVGRKMAGDDGESLGELVADIRAFESQLRSVGNPQLDVVADCLSTANANMERAVGETAQRLKTNPAGAMASSVTLLMLVGYVVGGWQMARSAQVALEKIDLGEEKEFHNGKLNTALFYLQHILPKTHALADSCLASPDPLLSMMPDQF